MPHNQSNQVPSQIKLKTGSGVLELTYADGLFELGFEFLRVYSPSAEVRGHGVGNEVLQYGKKHVVLSKVEAVGNYGLKLIFDDGHDSGIYTWPTLREYALNQEQLWQAYLDRLASDKQSREP
jgi:DUF971 family protein